jgi:hypothetical protein
LYHSIHQPPQERIRLPRLAPERYRYNHFEFVVFGMDTISAHGAGHFVVALGNARLLDRADMPFCRHTKVLYICKNVITHKTITDMLRADIEYRDKLFSSDYDCVVTGPNGIKTFYGKESRDEVYAYFLKEKRLEEEIALREKQSKLADMQMREMQERERREQKELYCSRNSPPQHYQDPEYAEFQRWKQERARKTVENNLKKTQEVVRYYFHMSHDNFEALTDRFYKELGHFIFFKLDIVPYVDGGGNVGIYSDLTEKERKEIIRICITNGGKSRWNIP